MNKYVPHVYVIPEDDAGRQIADGFVLHHQVSDTRIQVVPPPGGWAEVLKVFEDEYLQTLHQYPERHVVMLIDFDDHVEQRRSHFEQAIPDDLRARVFIVGVKDEAETLKKAVGISFEKIGQSLAADCDAGTAENWNHEQLQHNDAERLRLVQTVRPFLFAA
jgi:hypothetical protein